MRFSLWVILSIITVAASSIAQPTTQPLIQSSNVTYLGSFTVTNPSSAFSYGGMGLAVHPDGSSLYMGGHVNNVTLGRISIPSIGGNASIITSPVSVPGSIDVTGGELSGTFVYNNRVIITKRNWYDTDGGTGTSHMAGTLALDSFGSLYRFENLSYKQYVSGYMGIIPNEWRSYLGGPAFSGNGVMSINSQCSNGPSFYVFDPDDVGVDDPIPNIPLMYYDYPSHPLADYTQANDIFSKADQENAGIVFPSGTRSVLFWNKHGYGTPTYKSTTADPCDPDGAGEQAYPYRLQITAFDANDLLAVKNGTKQPWEPQPYAWWEIPPGTWAACDTFRAGSLAYNPSTNRVYAALHYGESPEIHVWQITIPADVPVVAGASTSLSLTASSTITPPGNSTGLSLTAGSNPVSSSDPTGLSLTANSSPSVSGNPTSLLLTANANPAIAGDVTAINLYQR